MFLHIIGINSNSKSLDYGNEKWCLYQMRCVSRAQKGICCLRGKYEGRLEISTRFEIKHELDEIC